MITRWLRSTLCITVVICSSERSQVSIFFFAIGSFEQRRHMYEKTNSFHLCLCKDLRGFGARTHKTTAEAEMETAIGECQLASLKGSNANIRRCLECVTWRGDWEQIRNETDGNEAELES